MADKYLLDSNVFITPHRSYYPFDFAKSFWNQMEERLRLEDVILLDVVFDEIAKYEDDLSTWLRSLDDCRISTVRLPEYFANYGRVLDYIQNCGLYKQVALREWAAGDIADPWLIAVAIETGATIITTETSAGPGLSRKNPAKKAKIPDVARHFGVNTEDLFYFIRRMGIVL